MSAIARALVSVSDKTGIVAFARALHDLGVEILSTGGTARATCDLVERAGGQLAGCAFFVELGFLGGRRRLDGVRVESLVIYE